jgi:hypothetical protein
MQIEWTEKKDIQMTRNRKDNLADKRLKRKDCGEKDKFGDVLYQMNTILEDKQ